VNKKTLALTGEQYSEIITALRKGFTGCRPNNRIATALIVEANLGLRISDVLKLRLNDIVKDGDRYRLDIVEQKTGKARTFTVLPELYSYIKNYCIDNALKPDDVIFPLTERVIQKQLKAACDYLGYEGISTHSFRKFFATNVYVNSGYNIVIVQRLLQHSSPEVTQRYIGIEPRAVEDALQKHSCLI